MPSRKRPTKPTAKNIPTGGYARPYLDSSVFIAWLNNETVSRKTGERVERGRVVEHVLLMAKQGAYQVVTSTLTLAEVHQMRGHKPLSEQQDEQILKFFESPFIDWVEVDREIGEHANRICRETGLWPNDAIHLASALRAGCKVLLAYDDRFVKKDGILPDISIEEPQMLGQLALIGDEGKGTTEVLGQ